MQMLKFLIMINAKKTLSSKGFCMSKVNCFLGFILLSANVVEHMRISIPALCFLFFFDQQLLQVDILFILSVQ